MQGQDQDEISNSFTTNTYQFEEIYCSVTQEGGEVGLAQKDRLDCLVRVIGAEGWVSEEDLVRQATQLHV